jgi:RNA recognition motif-containing protein
MNPFSTLSDRACCSETTSIPVNPRTNRPVGYAFVDLETAEEAEKAIAELSGKEILERKVSVQLARKPEPVGEKTEAPVSGGEGGSGGEGRKRGSGRGRGRGRGRGGRFRGATRGVCCNPFLLQPLLNLVQGYRRDW